MYIVKNGYKFWNYAKEKQIEIHLNKCPICQSEACLKGLEGEAHTMFSAFCPLCHIETREYHTDTNHYKDMGIEMAAKAWNNKEIYNENGNEIELL